MKKYSTKDLPSEPPLVIPIQKTPSPSPAGQTDQALDQFSQVVDKLSKINRDQDLQDEQVASEMKEQLRRDEQMNQRMI